MRHLINAYDVYGVPLDELKGLGWRGARRDVHSLEEAGDVLDQHDLAKMDPLLLINMKPDPAHALALELLWGLGGGFALQIGNEWDKDVDPLYARSVWESVATVAAQVPGVTVVTCGITTLSSNSLAWLRKALPKAPWHPEVVCGFHGYTSALLNEANRRAELTQLRSIIGDREAWNTETGWHMASKAKPFPLCWQREPGLSEQQVLANLRADTRIHAEFDIGTYVVYQLRDGQNDTPEDRFGIMDQAGKWKLQSRLPTAEG